MKYFVILLILIGFVSSAFAMHEPTQPYPHSIALPPDIKDKTFVEFMDWCKPYYGEKCSELYEQNHISNVLSPLKQIKSGIEPKDVVCKQRPIYYDLVMKKSNNQPICVKGTSVKTLTLRNYIPEYNGVLGGPIPTGDKTTSDTVIVDDKAYYFTIINETMNSAQGEDKQINFHNAVFTLLPKPKIMNLGGFCGSGSFGTTVLFSDGVREKLTINIPEAECMDKFTKDDLIKLTNHTNPQAGLTFYNNKVKLFVSADSDLVVPRGDLFLQSLRIEGLNDTYSVGQKIEFTVKFDGIGYDCGYPQLRIENDNHDIIWESSGIVSLCDPDMKKDHIEKEWKIGDNTHFGTPIIDKEGFYTLFVTFGHDVIQRDFWIK
jgi:WD40 repeat protein